MGTSLSARARSGARTICESPRTQVHLMPEFRLVVNGDAVALPHGVERIIAFLAICRTPPGRGRVASVLWPDVAEDRAQHDFRSALWRLRRIAAVIREDDHRLEFEPHVVVDYNVISDLTQSLITTAASPDLARIPDLVRAEDILSGWEEEWLVVERERFRMLRVRALERSAGALFDAEDYTGALDAALASITTEPFRESAHRLVIRIHLAEGNDAEALRAFRSYQALVADELGIQPSRMMTELVAPLAVHEFR